MPAGPTSTSPRAAQAAARAAAAKSAAKVAAKVAAKSAAKLQAQRAKRWAAVAAESPVSRTRRARRMYRELHDLYPYAHCELDFRSPWELLIATVLSAQTTDVRVNLTTPELFAAYPGPAELAAADRADVERIIQPTGFFRAKTASIMGLAAAVLDRYDGLVPGRLVDLVTLPGVGRKTANVVLGNAFGVPGITVDTHFGRLSRRMGWTEEDDPVKVEAEVGALFPKKDWTMLSHVLIFHGRRTCHAKRPACGACPVAALCPSYGDGETDPVLAQQLLKYERAPGATTAATAATTAMTASDGLG